MKIKITDLKIDKIKERGQILQINHDEVAKKIAGYQALPPLGLFRVTAWEHSRMTRFAFLHAINVISSPHCAVVHDLRCRWLALRSEWATWDRGMQKDRGNAAQRGQRTAALARILQR